jgi:Holliday junction DNA helicase RuvA
MIGLLRGTVVERTGEGSVILEVAGVGFALHVPAQTAPEAGAEVTLHVETVVREDAITLYGFPSRGHLAAFKLLRKVKRIGPRLALAILSAMPPEQVAMALSRGEAGAFKAVPGIGAKTAQMIVIELKDQVRKLTSESPTGELMATGRLGELINALEHLGFRPAQAQAAAMEVKDLEASGAELTTLIREALKKMS